MVYVLQLYFSPTMKVSITIFLGRGKCPPTLFQEGANFRLSFFMEGQLSYTSFQGVENVWGGKRPGGLSVPLPHVLTPRSSRQVRESCAYAPFRVFSCASDRPFVIERQVCSLSTKPQVSTIHCVIRSQFVVTVQRIANIACLPVQRTENKISNVLGRPAN